MVQGDGQPVHWAPNQALGMGADVCRAAGLRGDARTAKRALTFLSLAETSCHSVKPGDLVRS